MTDTFFELEAGRGGVPRDYEGNALILPRGATSDRLVPYTPASALADFISDDRHIHRWEMRNLAKAMGQNPDLCELAASETYSTNLSAPTVGREKTASGKRLDRIIERALDRVGLDEKADYGTAVHAWTEPDNGQPVSERARADVDSFTRCIKDNGIKIVATEIFTANDQVRGAGTFDHLCWIPGYGFVICDKKTGKMDVAHFGVQLSTYANGEIYDPENPRKRRSLEELCDFDLNTDVGIVFAISNGVTKLREVDLNAGWSGAQAAARARDYHATIAGTLGDAEAFVSRHAKRERVELARQLAGCQTRVEALALWRENEHLWTDEMTTTAKGLPV